MNILVVGNGFDLAHGLPTTYNDFLTFLMEIDMLSSSNMFDSDDTNRIINPKNNVSNFMNIFLRKRDTEVFRKILILIDNNIFAKYFINMTNKIGETWIDFESEISRIIRQIEYFINYDLINPNGKNRLDTKELLIYNELSKKISFNMKNHQHQNEFQKKHLAFALYELLLKDLNRFIKCFEIYLCSCSELTVINTISPDIKRIHIDGLLSFNYIDTYKKVYKPSDSLKYCFIHGKVRQNNISDNNMVLGIDEYLSDEDCKKNFLFIGFRKYYQRIYKNTDISYIDWLESYDNINRDKDIYIFGHSLDITDKDVIQKLIRSNKSKVTIFYHNKVANGQQIANLVKIIGMDELNERTRGANRNIEFRQLQTMESI